jgi:hypothetical protein
MLLEWFVCELTVGGHRGVASERAGEKEMRGSGG